MKILLTALLSLTSTLSTAGHFSAVQGKFDCPGILNSLECARQIESGLGERVARTPEDGLRVLLDNGHERILAGAEATYLALEILPTRHLLVVFEQREEGGRYGWLDLASGEYRQLPGYPLFSPQGDLVAMAQQDVAAGYDPNVLEIYRHDPGGLELVHRVATPDWGPGEVRWTDGGALKFRRVSVSCEAQGVSSCPEFELSRGASE